MGAIVIAALSATAAFLRLRESSDLTCKASTNAAPVVQIPEDLKRIFYGLPLELSRLDLREVIVHDQRFKSTDTTFNGLAPASFFKGTTSDQGLIQSNPDSIQVMLIYGDAALVTERGGDPDFDKHPVIFECRYFYSNKDSAEREYEQMVRLLEPIFTDSSAVKTELWESEYAQGIQKCNGKVFDHYGPYFRTAISTINFIPDDGSTEYFVLNVSFSKEDK